MFEGPATPHVSPGSQTQPRSLYWEQLVARMGGNIQHVKSNVGAEGRMHYPPRI